VQLLEYTSDQLYFISNIREENYGLYLLESENLRRNKKNPHAHANFTFTLKPNLVPNLIYTTTLIGCCIGILCFLIIIIIFMLYNSVYIRVYYKRYFGVYIVGEYP